MLKPYLISCDWGTTTCRVRLVNTNNHQILDEYVSQEGISRTHEAWKATSSPPQYKCLFFKNALKKHITILAEQSKKPLEGIDIALSGMASSSIGLYELPYASTPFDLDGNHLKIHEIEADENLAHKIFLISGVRCEDDVMRGEETQMIGLNALLGLNTVTPERHDDASVKGDCILILPGTHSKHIHIKNNYLTAVNTFMTGEMFNILSHYSILKDSIETLDVQHFTQQAQNAFNMGVLETNTTSLLNSLFKVRTNQLFQKMDKTENAFYLSGLLIGYELKYLVAIENEQLILCSGNNLYGFYKSAIDILGLTERTIIVPSETLDKAVVIGQIIVVRKFISRTHASGK
jgi:2-dehydro-3-deoxygalactonokinase